MMKIFGNDKEYEESRLQQRLRNLNILTTDDELIGNRTTRKDEEFG